MNSHLIDPLDTEDLFEEPKRIFATLGGHFDELRDKIIRIATILAAGWAIGWFLQPSVYQTLSTATHQLISSHFEYREVFRNITDPFMLKLRLSFLVGLIVTLPLCILQIWSFVAPGLKSKEKRIFKLLAPVSVVLFGMGAWLCWMVLPSVFGWFVSYLKEFPQTAVYQEPGTLVFFTLKMMLAFGIGFQLPIIVFFSAKLGLVRSEVLLKYWRHIVIGIFILSMIVVPSADPMSLILLALPLSLLFFLSVFAVRLTMPKRAKIL